MSSSRQKSKHRLFGAPLDTIIINEQLPEILQVCSSANASIIDAVALAYLALDGPSLEWIYEMAVYMTFSMEVHV